MTEVVPTSQRSPVSWRYTFQKPEDHWARPDFNDRQWKEGPGGFGTRGTPGAIIGTTWNTPDIWLRREVTLPASIDSVRVQLLTYHDEGIEVYIDGILAAKESGYLSSYQPLEIFANAQQQLKPGANVVLAAHCHQTAGGQGVDVGLIDVDRGKP